MFICIDLKSFYASAECVERGLDPLNTNLVVADLSRTEKTICLAVTPSLKAIGVPGRPRLFEVAKIVGNQNRERLKKSGRFTDKSIYASELASDPSLEIGYVVAPPRMARYMEVSAKIYEIYLHYVSSEDIHVYSIDEVFIDVTGYLDMYHCTAHELAMKMIRDVLKETGITATAGIGTNLYLAKVAMDIVAKKCLLTQTEFVLLNLMRCLIVKSCGSIHPLLISGVSAVESQENWLSIICLLWEILHCVLNCMKISYISCSGKMRN